MKKETSKAVAKDKVRDKLAKKRKSMPAKIKATYHKKESSKMC